MMKRLITRVMLVLMLAAIGVTATACSQTASEEQLSGQAHERHASGIDSQVRDN
jgi:hypothetical protein